MINVSISSKLKTKCSNLRLSCIEVDVVVCDSDQLLLSKIQEVTRRISGSVEMEQISRMPAIHASRVAYKACGKDPARYRLSAEALLRRVISGKGLYQINNVVDQLNLVSISSGFSIGGYDAERINGSVVFGIGDSGETYSGIGRGELNIGNLPVFRDDSGAFGTPTSDSPRTEVSAATHRFLMILIDFGRNDELESATQLATELLISHCQANNINVLTIE